MYILIDNYFFSDFIKKLANIARFFLIYILLIHILLIYVLFKYILY